VIVYEDRVDSAWWRKSGHELAPEDIGEVLDASPEVLVVGTGASGLVKVLPATEALLREKGITLMAERTGRACAAYNRMLSEGTKVIAALHLTC